MSTCALDLAVSGEYNIGAIWGKFSIICGFSAVNLDMFYFEVEHVIYDSMLEDNLLYQYSV
ncbi:hypothetical protein ISN44_As02g016540 [Arabidopsis suecica]|uniref:Uncharacterized protein n=1 Tax=Arabidopsis suecica TaxID=45249 RepID=A0A8T2G2F0_ARASU|nr:hypothetical protein ISN44_As02g016540 [Arabidopsis suecica]